MSLRLPPKEYAILCRKVLQRDHYRCRACGYRANLTVHHVRFRSHGGEDSIQNLLTVCAGCHRGLHEEQGLLIKTHDGEEVNADIPLRFVRLKKWKPS
jgi:5-methylcytosine-specific restriction endonuclease McrA